ncbi:T9SS type A sorting domain-containing protein, partial [bacterium]|nr:T9SS type A sorting domain-containing protein [bacterium]
VITGEFLAQILFDTGVNGLQPPNADGSPSGDDVLVSESLITPIPGVQPEGTVVYFLDFDDSQLMGPSMYLRIFNSNEPQTGDYYTNSQNLGVPGPANIQMVARFPDRMRHVIGGNPIELIIDPTEQTVAAGGAAIFSATASADQEDHFVFSVNANGLPGGDSRFTLRKINNRSAEITWIPPFGAQGNQYDLPIYVTDGAYTANTTVSVTVVDPGDVPSAFHLVSPEPTQTLWENIGFSWQEAQDPDFDEVFYSLTWADNDEFNNADSLTDLQETSVAVAFENGLTGDDRYQPTQKQDRFEKKSQPSFQREKGDLKTFNDKKAIRSLEPVSTLRTNTTFQSALKSNRSLMSFSPRTDQTLLPIEPEQRSNNNFSLQHQDPAYDPVPLDIQDGDSVYWRVRAYDSDGNTLWSIDTWSAYAEVPDAPNAFTLLSPADGSEIDILGPTLSWEEATDIDHGDLVSYDLIWSLDNWATIDTIFNIESTSFSFDEPEVTAHPGGAGFIRAYYGALLEEATELDELPDEVTVSWTVDAVDRAGMRTQADDSWEFHISRENGPTPFALRNPANGTVITQTGNIGLSWTEAFDNDDGDEVSYTLYVDLTGVETNPEDFELEISNLTEITYVFNADEPERIVRWAVKAISGGEEIWAYSGENGYFEFYVTDPTPPEPFALGSPADGGFVPTLEPTVTWNPSFEYDLFDRMDYTVYWSLDNWATLDSVVGIPDTSYTFREEVLLGYLEKQSDGGEPGSLKKNKSGNQSSDSIDELDEFDENANVWWKVRARDMNTVGRWCNPLQGNSFTVYDDDPPWAFNLFSPENGHLLDDTELETVTFSWHESMDPDEIEGFHYVLQYSQDRDFVDADSVIATEETVELARTSFEQLSLYYWRVFAVDAAGNRIRCNYVFELDVPVAVPDAAELEIPKEFTISSVYPNPFNPTLTVEVGLPEKNPIRITALDILGREVLNWGPEIMDAGYHRLMLDLSGRPSGTYFIKVSFLGKSESVLQKRVMLVK